MADAVVKQHNKLNNICNIFCALMFQLHNKSAQKPFIGNIPM